MSADEAQQLTQLLYWYAETELDQWDNWRLDTATGPVYVSMSTALPRAGPTGRLIPSRSLGRGGRLAGSPVPTALSKRHRGRTSSG